MLRFAGFLLGTTLSLAVSAAPTTVHHSGRLLDAGGTALNGQHDLTFRLYDDATAGTVQWSEVLSNVPLSGGYYSVDLGQTNPMDSAALDGDRWLAVGIGSPVVELSRVQLAAVPWALRTQLATGVQLNGVSGGTTPAPCTPAEEGVLRYNTDRSSLEFCHPIDGAYTWSDLIAPKTIVGNDSAGRSYSDGTYDTSCAGYRTDPAYNSEPTGKYLIDVPSLGAVAVQCDMTTDGGGWTLLFSEDFTGQEDGPTQAEMNSSGGDLFTGDGRAQPSPVGLYGDLAATDVMYDLQTHKLVTPDVSAADWAWFMSTTTSASTRVMSTGAYIVGGTTFTTVHHHKWSQGQGEISTNTTWDNSVILDYGLDTNHGWAVWTAGNGVYKRLGGYQTPANVTVKIWAR